MRKIPKRLKMRGRLKHPRVYWVDLIGNSFRLSKMLGVAFTQSEAQQLRSRQNYFTYHTFGEWWKKVERHSEPLV